MDSQWIEHNLTYLLLDADRIYKIMQNETFLSFVHKFALDCIFSNEYSYNFETYMVVLSVQNEIKWINKIINITLFNTAVGQKLLWKIK